MSIAPEATPDSAYLVDLLSRLVALDTQNPPGRNYLAICELLAAELAPLGFKTSLHTPPPELQQKHVPGWEAFPRTNLVARLDVGAARTLHFNSHFDVVPASNAGWTSSPFELRQSRGWVYGRGTADMKGAIVSMVEAARMLRRSGRKPKCNIEFSLVCDEESGSELGAAWLVRSGIIRPDYAVVCEGGSGKRVCIGHNGTLWYEVNVTGKSAHASTPERGLNAFDRACDLAVGLRAYAKRISRRTYRSPDGFTMRSTMNVGGSASTGEGGKINTVPNHFSFTIDRRILPNESYAESEKELKAELASLRARIPGLRFTLRMLERNLPCLVDRSGPLPVFAAQAVSRVRRTRACFTVSTGFNDMHWFATAGIPVIAYGPGGERFHGVDERARVKDIADSASIYTRLMMDFDGAA